jgi:ankyrin repeat protein
MAWMSVYRSSSKIDLDAYVRALHVAARKGHRNLEQLLSNKDANLVAKDNTGRSVLHNATIFGQEWAVKLILMHSSIKPNSKDKYGRTPLSFATSGGNEDVAAAVST